MNRRQFLYRSSLLSLATAGMPLASRAFQSTSDKKATDLYMSDKRQEGDRSFAYAINLPQAKMPAELKGITEIEIAILDYGSGSEKPVRTVYVVQKNGKNEVNEAYITFMIGKAKLMSGSGALPKEFLSKSRFEIVPRKYVTLKVDKDTVRLNYREPNEEDDDSYSDCFLTSACVLAKGLPDDCEELASLRHYRDSYLRQTDAGAALVAEYYTLGPRIVAAINSRTNHRAIYDELYASLVLPSLQCIRAGAFIEARDYYRDYTETLKEIFLKD